MSAALYRIEVGRTDGFRYIGVQPPLEEAQVGRIFDVLGEDIRLESVANGRSFAVVRPDIGEPYSEIGLHAVHDPERVSKVASSVVRSLTAEGHAVEVNTQIQRIGFGRHLFGGQAERLG